jgi:plastocyanin
MFLRYSATATAMLAVLSVGTMAGCTPASLAPSNPTTAAVAVYATDSQGRPVSDALVYLKPLENAARTPVREAAPAELDLEDRQFQPRLLVLRAGASLVIQNFDDVGHEVYSFSDARPMAVRLAAGERSALLDFSKPGLVVLGCKIHSEMIGYIYVTDAPYFGKTDNYGYLRISGVAVGRYELRLWQVGESANNVAFRKTVSLTGGAEEMIRIRL